MLSGEVLGLAMQRCGRVLADSDGVDAKGRIECVQVVGVTGDDVSCVYRLGDVWPFNMAAVP